MRYTSSAKPSMQETEVREYWEESFPDYDDFTPRRERIHLDDALDLVKILREARMPRGYRP